MNSTKDPMVTPEHQPNAVSPRILAEQLLEQRGSRAAAEHTPEQLRAIIRELELQLIESDVGQGRSAVPDGGAAVSGEHSGNIVQALPAGVAVISSHGIIIEMNQEAASLLEAQLPMAVGKMLGMFVSHDSKQELYRFLDGLKRGAVRCDCDLSIDCAGGSRRYIHLIGTVSPKEREFLLSIFDNTEWKLTEEALRESELKYRMFYENVPVGLYRTTVDGRIIMANHTLVRMLGFSTFEELAQRNLEESGFEPSYPRKLFIEQIERDGEINDLIGVWKCRNGNTLMVNEHARAIRDLTGKTMYYDGTVEDITEEKRLEKAVLENEEIFKQYFSHSPVYIFIKDAQMRAIRLSANFSTMLGKPMDELLGRTSSELFPSKFAEKLDRDDRALLQESKTVSFEEELNGRYYSTIKFPIIINGKPQYLAGFTIDITERKQYEESIRLNEERYRSLFHDNFAVILIVDPVSGSIKDANAAACRYYGYALHELCSMNIDQINIFSPEEIRHEMEQAVMNHQGHFNFKHRLAGGEVRDVEVISSLINVNGSKILYSLIYDTTEFNRTKVKLQQAEHRLRQAEKMEAIGQLAGGIAHDFNNILTGIIGFASLSQRQAENDPALKSNIEQILAASNRAKQLTQQILAFSRQSVQKKEIVNIAPIVDEALKLLRASVPSTVTIEYSQLGISRPVLADPVRIHEIILNLANNAVHA
ncbi:MAG: PAS domain S-box protein, partial [Bacteroidota bacterium]